jgi:hypothetical protein
MELYNGTSWTEVNDLNTARRTVLVHGEYNSALLLQVMAQILQQLLNYGTEHLGQKQQM